VSNSYQTGNVVRMSVQFADSAGAPADPSVVNLTIQFPDGTMYETTYGTHSPIQQSGTGAYYIDYTVESLGRWWYRWWSTGTNTASASGNFNVTDWS